MRRTRTLSPQAPASGTPAKKARVLEGSPTSSSVTKRRTLQEGDLQSTLTTPSRMPAVLPATDTELLATAFLVPPRNGRPASSSSSTTDPEDDAKAAGRQEKQRVLRSRVKNRLRKYLTAAFESRQAGTTLLESYAVTPAVQAYYQAELKDLQNFVKANSLDFTTDEGIDQAIVSWMNACFWKGAGSQGGEAPGCPDALQAGLWTSWQPETASSLARAQGLAQAYPLAEQAALPSASVGRPSLRTETTRVYKDGSVLGGGPEFLRSTRRTVALHDVLFGPASCLRQPPLEPFAFSRTLGAAGENRRVRHQCHPRLPLPPALVPGCLHAAQEAAAQHASLGFRLRRLHQGVPGGGSQSPSPGVALPNASLGAKHRPRQRLAHTAGSATPRRLAKSQVRDALREVCPTQCSIPRAPPSSARPLPVVRRTSRGCRPWASSGQVPAMTPKHRARYFLDLFSGKGGVSAAWRRLGFRSFEFELQHGPASDLTSRSVLGRVLQSIRKGEVLGAMLAPPCSSFSVARDRTVVIRTAEAPWGLPSHFLSAKDQVRVATGNRCMRSALRILKVLDQLRLPWCLENPATSKIWCLPPLQQLMQQSHVQAVTVDFCQFSTPWRKPTTLLFGNLDAQDVARLLHRQCAGPPGLCSRTGLPHKRLTGNAPDGRPWTLHAQPYPPRLCADLAFALSSPYLTTDPTTLWHTSI